MRNRSSRDAPSPCRGFLASLARTDGRIAAAQQPLLLAVPLAILDRRALVVLLLALGEADRELDAAVLVVQVDRRQRVARRARPCR